MMEDKLDKGSMCEVINKQLQEYAETLNIL